MSAMKRLLCLALFVVGACSTQAEIDRGGICLEINKFARSLEPGETKSVRLTRGGAWLVDHYKTCARPSDDPSAQQFCGWLVENTSTEFMEANINLTLSCLQGQILDGYIGNTGIESWTGRIQFYSPSIDTENVDVVVEYSVGYFDDEVTEDFLEITLVRDPK